MISIRTFVRLGIIASIPLMLGLGWTVFAQREVIPATATDLGYYGLVPEFWMRDQENKPFERTDLMGKVWVADFIFTRCAGQCPLMTAQVKRLLEAFRGADSLRVVSFTVDPEHDSPEALTLYAKTSKVSDSRWRLVTGTHEEITRLSKEGFKLPLGVDEDPQEPILHSTRLVLVDRDAAIRGYYDAFDEPAMLRLQRDLQRLLRKE